VGRIDVNEHIQRCVDMQAHHRWLEMAGLVSESSPDPSTKLGVVLVDRHGNFIASDCNRFVGLVSPLPERLEKRPEKYRWIEHAERNALYTAVRNGEWLRLLGATMYINAGLPPCSDCTRALIALGVKRVVGVKREFHGVGKNVHYHCGEVEETMLREGGVELHLVEVTGVG
jgi:dCMP deaminase